MQLPPPTVLLEFNELTPDLMDRFIAGGELPNLKKLHDRSQVYISQAEEQAPDLEPWIQWVNVHTGVPYAEHGIYNLSEGHKLRYKNVWDLASEAGLPVWVCGSMNVRYDSSIRGHVLPDPWATDVAPHPKTLQPYFRFIQQNVLEYTNDRVPLTGSDYMKFLTFMVRHGLSADSIASTIKQLAAEKKTGQGRWRRAFIMEKLQFDLFSAIYQRLKPRFSTFFLNSTAHMQHKYWRHMEPELFKVRRQGEDQYESAILLGYQAMDQIVGRMLSLVGDQAVVILATALGQQPCLKYEEEGTKHGYRPHDPAELLTFAGITCARRVAPVMAEQFWVHLERDSDATEVETKLAALRVGQRKAVNTRRDGLSVFASCAINQLLPKDAVLSVANSNRTVPFFEMFYSLGGGKSGMHHPDGILWIRDFRRAHAIHSEKVGLVSIAPTILEMLGIDKPDYMNGTSLFAGKAARSPSLEEATQRA